MWFRTMFYNSDQIMTICVYWLNMSDFLLVFYMQHLFRFLRGSTISSRGLRTRLHVGDLWWAQLILYHDTPTIANKWQRLQFIIFIFNLAHFYLGFFKHLDIRHYLLKNELKVWITTLEHFGPRPAAIWDFFLDFRVCPFYLL